MFQYDYADYSIFFLIYWDALEDYMSYNETNMFNLDYEEICMDKIREELNMDDHCVLRNYRYTYTKHFVSLNTW